MSSLTSEEQDSEISTELMYVNIAIDIGPKITQATWVYTTKGSGPRLRGLHAWPRYNTREDQLIDPRLRNRKDPSNRPLIERYSTILYPVDGLGKYGERLKDKDYGCMGVPINLLLFGNDDLSDQDAQRLHDTRVWVMRDFLKEVQREMEDASPNNALPKNYKAVYNISCGKRDVTEAVRKVFKDLATLLGLKPEDLRITCAARDIVYADMDETVNDCKDGELHMAVHHLRDGIEFTKFKVKKIDQNQTNSHLEILDVSYELVPLETLIRQSWEYAVGTCIPGRGRLSRPPDVLDFQTSFGLIEGLDWVFDQASRGNTDTLFRTVESGCPIVGTVVTIRAVHERVLFHINNQIVAQIAKLDATNAKLHIRSGIYTPMMGKAVSMFHGNRLDCLPMRKAWFPRITKFPQNELVAVEWIENLSILMDLWFPHSSNTPAQASTPPPEEALTRMSLSETDSDGKLAKD